MRRFHLSTVLLSLSLMAGCQGGSFYGKGGDDVGTPDAGSTTPPPNATARELFDITVAPALTAECSACHSGGGTSPQFMGPGPAAYYASITADTRFVNDTPSNSLLLLKGQHTGPLCNPARSDMSGKTFCTSTVNTAVAAWLTKEAEERMITPPPPPPPGGGTPTTLEAALTKFGKCMTITDWNSTGMNDLQNQNTTQGRCYACHATGTAGAYLSTNSDDNLTMIKTSPYILKLVTGTVNANGTFKDLVPAYRFRDKANDTGHPSYVLSAAREQALTDFFNLTYTHYMAGACP